MLTKDGLEELEIVFLPDDGTLHDTEDGEHLASLGPRRRAGIGPLFAAAPKLALACLEARDALSYAVSHLALTDDVPYEREIQIVDEALAAAGVEVP